MQIHENGNKQNMKLESCFKVYTILLEHKHSFISDNSEKLSTLKFALGDGKMLSLVNGLIY